MKMLKVSLVIFISAQCTKALKKENSKKGTYDMQSIHNNDLDKMQRRRKKEKKRYPIFVQHLKSYGLDAEMSPLQIVIHFL